jgi:hypothetical protein
MTTKRERPGCAAPGQLRRDCPSRPGEGPRAELGQLRQGHHDLRLAPAAGGDATSSYG